MTENATPQNDQQKKAQVQAYFSRTAENYVASTSHRTGTDLLRLQEIGEFSQDQQALDIATGGGHTALAVAPHVAQITVSDITPHMLTKAREFITAQGITNAQFQEADAENLPFAANSFDRVTCRIAPHHFPNVARFIQEVARVLKSQGLFLLIDSVAPSDPELDTFINTVEKWRDNSHGRSCTKEEWAAFFAQSGLHIEASESFRRTHEYDDWTERSQLSISEKASLESYILESDSRIQNYFGITLRDDGHIENITMDYMLLKGRKHT